MTDEEEEAEDCRSLNCDAALDGEPLPLLEPLFPEEARALLSEEESPLELPTELPPPPVPERRCV